MKKLNYYAFQLSCFTVYIIGGEISNNLPESSIYVYDTNQDNLYLSHVELEYAIRGRHCCMDTDSRLWCFGTENNRIVYFAGDDSLLGNFVNVRITEASPNSLKGELIYNI